MELLKKQLTLYGSLFGGVIICILSDRSEMPDMIKTFGILSGIVLLIYGCHYLIYKFHCPKCHHIYPRLISFSEDYCPHCGEPIE